MTHHEIKRLYRSRQDRVFAGIVGGLSEYLEQDSVVLRLLAVTLLIFTGFIPFGLIYLIAIFIIPQAPHSTP